MEGVTTSQVAAWVNTLGGTIFPVKQRTALHELVLQRDMNGRTFSMILNQHGSLTDFNLPDMTLAMATKVRKCWHRDFPESVNIQAPRSSQADQDNQGRSGRYDPCQDGGDYSGFKGYAGYKPGPGTGRGGRGGGAPSPHPSPDKPSRALSQAVTVSLEVLRAALDCVAERADLKRHDMYLWVHDVIPDEVWHPLWASLTSDMMREQQNRSGNMGTPPLKTMGSPLPARAYSPEAPSPQGYPAQAYHSQDNSPRDELASLPELRSRVEGQRIPTLDWVASDRQDFQRDGRRDFQHDDDLHSHAPTDLRSEAETMASDAVSAWLDRGAECGAKFSPFELANWLRTLPKDRLEGDTLKVVARQVLDAEMDEEQFEQVIANEGLASMGVSDPRQAKVLERYFRQRQTEAVMAAAAKQTGALNNSFRAKKAEAMDI